MTNLITGLIGIGLWVAFVGFILVWLKAPPLIIIAPPAAAAISSCRLTRREATLSAGKTDALLISAAFPVDAR